VRVVPGSARNWIAVNAVQQITRKKKMKKLNIITALLFLGCAIAFGQLPSPSPDGGYPNGNTAEGDNALYNLSVGSYNTAMGTYALYYNTTGNNNTATGAYALFSNQQGVENTATGVGALGSNTTGYRNTATGVDALVNNTSGVYNTVDGYRACDSNTTGNFNTVIGSYALNSNITGGNNIAIGWNAGANSPYTYQGIYIGNMGQPTDANVIRIGDGQQNTYISGISGVTIANGSPVVVIEPNGHLGTVPVSSLQGATGPMALKVMLVPQVLQVLLVLKVIQEQQVQQDQSVLKVYQEQQVLKVLPAQLRRVQLSC
jgi:hypothetical protein